MFHWSHHCYNGGSSGWVLGWAWGGAKECEGYKVGKGVGVCVHFRTKEQGGVWVEVIGGVRECEEQGGVWGCSADWWVAPVTGSNLITSCSPALPLKHTMPEQDHGNSHWLRFTCNCISFPVFQWLQVLFFIFVSRFSTVCISFSPSKCPKSPKQMAHCSFPQKCLLI